MMATYKLVLLQMIGSLNHDCADDLDAVDFAYDLCRNHTVEVYEGERLVARVKQGSERES